MITQYPYLMVVLYSILLYILSLYTLSTCRGAQALNKNTAVAKNIVQKKETDLSKKVKQAKQEIAMTKKGKASAVPFYTNK